MNLTVLLIYPITIELIYVKKPVKVKYEKIDSIVAYIIVIILVTIISLCSVRP
ncbi:hypothetical protein YN1HA_9560 [Sulfurisphaera ohwakuensis]